MSWLRKLLDLIVAQKNPSTVENAARTAVAAVASYLVARLVRLPEAYWASISTIVVMQSTMGAALPVSVQRFAGTAIGAAVGGFALSAVPGNLWVFGIATFLIGVFCAALRIERSAYRYACITLAIVMLVPHNSSPWLIPVHRFFEVSLGIAMGLVISAVWPER